MTFDLSVIEIVKYRRELMELHFFQELHALHTKVAHVDTFLKTQSSVQWKKFSANVVFIETLITFFSFKFSHFNRHVH